MAESRTPLQEAVDTLARGDDRGALDSPRRLDPVRDAVTMAAAAVGTTARAPDRQLVHDLGEVDATLTASGLMTWGVELAGRWWTALTSPLLVHLASGPAVVLPDAHGGDLVEAGTRTTKRLRRGTADAVSGPCVAVAREIPADTRWWRLLAWSLGRSRGDLWLLLLFGVLGGFAGLLLPLATQAIFEQAVPSGDAGRVAVILVVLALGSTGAAVLVLVRGLLVVRLRDRSDAALGPAVTARLLRLPATFFRRRPVGDVVNRALSVDAARQQVDDSVLAALVTAAFGLVNLLYLLAADLLVGLISTAATVAVLGLSLLLQMRARRLLPSLLEARSRSDATLLAILGSLVTWRVAGAEDRALARWAADQGRSTVALNRRLRAVALTGPNDVAAPLVVVVALVIAVIAVPSAKLEPGASSAPGVFLALYAAVAQLALSMMALSSQLVTLSELGPVLDRLHPVLTEARERTVPVQQPGTLSGAVALEHVVFGYRRDQAPLLDGIDLAVRPGEFVAVVGPSGGGKSTVLRLLLGFDEPWDGAVTYDGRDLAGLDPVAVRRQLGVVLQASRPLGTTVRECVTGPRLMDDDEVWSLLEHAGLADDVSQMPDRLASPVGDHGLLLSGGQRQRLMIAAALAGRPRILMLDEATSALDNVTQRVVMRTVLTYPATRIVIAHRMTTVQDADRVVVVTGGSIAEEGPPADLLAAGGHFARLARRQEV